jgi:NitT/TauT family transport system substrate-binding protein
LPAQIGRAAVNAGHAHAGMTTVRMAFSTWTGYGPLVVAVQKGMFKKYGLNVTYTVVEDPTDRFAAFKAGRLDAIATTVDTFTRQAARGAPVVQVFGIDRSVGGDGIVARKNITSVKQLKGKTVAVNVGSTSEFFLAYVLQQNGMSINDIHIQDMPNSGTAGSTFVAGRTDVAVTWEPWLDRAEKVPFGHVLVSSKEYPNIIVDVFGFRTDFLGAHRSIIPSFIKAYYEAVDQVNAGDPSALKSVKYDLTTVKLMNLAQSKAYFGTAASHGAIYAIARQSATFWLSIKKIDKMPNINAIVDPTFLQKM